MRFRTGPWLLGMLACCALSARADIRETGHNLAHIGPTPRVDAGATCVFCHTPLVGEPGDNGPPAWQRALPRGFAYAALESVATQAGRELGPPSMVCLSCHDANQARTAADPREDHPFSVPFRGWPGAAAGESEGPFARALRTDPGQSLDYRLTSSGRIDERIVWWVSTAPGLRRSRSDLPLYGRRGPGGDEIPYIECASCHDPHTSARLFLRVSNEGSRLCLSCHVI